MDIFGNCDLFLALIFISHKSYSEISTIYQNLTKILEFFFFLLFLEKSNFLELYLGFIDL